MGVKRKKKKKKSHQKNIHAQSVVPNFHLWQIANTILASNDLLEELMKRDISPNQFTPSPWGKGGSWNVRSHRERGRGGIGCGGDLMPNPPSSLITTNTPPRPWW
jgi:hypothetical protein